MGTIDDKTTDAGVLAQQITHAYQKHCADTGSNETIQHYIAQRLCRDCRHHLVEQLPHSKLKYQRPNFLSILRNGDGDYRQPYQRRTR